MCFDPYYNTIQRTSQRNQDSGVILDENYTYDILNRLTNVDMVSIGNISRSYDALGNITSKNGNTYTYFADRSHTVQTALGNTSSYDSNDSMLDGAGRNMV